MALKAPSVANDSGSPNPLTNMDGFGVGWWTTAYSEFENGIDADSVDALKPVVYKNTRPPLNDLVLASLARGVSTRAVVAHVRAGTGLTPVVETNCHPFTFGRYLFAHNGVLGDFHLFKADLLRDLPLRYQVAVLGTTDSEHIAALYFYYLCRDDGDWEALYSVRAMADAMIRTIQSLETRQKTAQALYGEKQEYSTLNIVVSSGSSMIAVRYASGNGIEPPSLYYSTTAGATLNRKFSDERRGEHGKHVIVASEPSTFNVDEWEAIPPGQMVMVDGDAKLSIEDVVANSL
jgi:glutamine amidotransferase